MADDDVTAVGDLPDVIGGLAALMMLGMSESVTGTTRQLYEAERDERYRAEAELSLIRQRIAVLAGLDFAPSMAAIARALYPSAQAVKVRAAELATEEAAW